MNEISPNDVLNDIYEQIINSIKAHSYGDLEALLRLDPCLSQEEEFDIYNEGKDKILSTLLKFPRFHKFVDFSIMDTIFNEYNDYLFLLDVENIYTQLDEDGNNFLQYIFGKLYLEPDEFIESFPGEALGEIIQELAKRLDPLHRNNNGETAEDILRKRSYNQASLIMFAEYRKIVPSFPFLDLPICSFKITSDKLYSQPLYACHTCDLDGWYGVCEACISKCHKNHSVNYLGVMSCFCDCCMKKKHNPKLFDREKDISEKLPLTQ